MKLLQFKNAYRYNSDSLMLYSFCKNIYGNVLDVGCGSGILGLLLKRDFPEISLFMCDILEQNCTLAAKNAKENGLLAQIFALDFSKFDKNIQFDFIISNPPFYHKNVLKSENSHKNFAKNSANLSLENLLNKAFKILKPKGKLIFCYDARQISEILKAFSNLKFSPVRIQFVYATFEKNSKLGLFELEKNSKKMCEILPPIAVNLGNSYTQKAKEIFAKANLESVDCE